MGKVDEAKIILKDLGMPKAQQNEISALTLLALCGIKENSEWSSAGIRSLTVTKGIINFIKEEYGKDYAPNTRETFRRQVLHQFVQGGITDYNPDDPDLPTNSPNAHYAVTLTALEVVKNYKTNNYGKALNKLKKKNRSLVERYGKN